MRFLPLPLSEAWLVEIEAHRDDRGFFGRSFCRDEFARRGLASEFPQCNVSWNAARGTLRGVHYQRPPYEEAKLVRCTAGAIWDVVVDLRPGSASRYRWHGVELSAENRRALYVPDGFAHGFLTLRDDSEVFYQMSAPHVPDVGQVIRFDDPFFGIDWPATPRVLSPRDRDAPDFSPDDG